MIILIELWQTCSLHFPLVPLSLLSYLPRSKPVENTHPPAP